MGRHHSHAKGWQRIQFGRVIQNTYPLYQKNYSFRIHHQLIRVGYKKIIFKLNQIEYTRHLKFNLFKI